MSTRRLWISTTVAVLLLNLYPLKQAIECDGVLFYANAFDEPTYLQYEFAQTTRSPTRPGQYLVALGHELGVSGGWLNLGLDTLCIAVFVVCTAGALRRYGWERPAANRGAFLLAFLPLLFGGLNPVVARLFHENLASGLIYWVTIPEASTLPLVRSPEPQFSLALASAAVWAALSWRSWLAAYLCLPFLYPFVAIPLAFVTVALHLKQRFAVSGPHVWKCLAASFGLVGLLVYIYTSWFVPPRLREFLIPTHLPLVSFTSVIALCLAGAAAWRGRIGSHFLLVALVLAPLVAVNQQVVSGWLAVPSNYEQYFGVLCAAGVLVLCCPGRIAEVLVVVSLVAVGWSGYQSVRHNDPINSRLTLSPELLQILRERPEDLAIANSELAARASLMFPRQRATTFGYQKTFGTLREKSAREYYCARDRIAADAELRPHFADLFAMLDRRYASSQEFSALLYIGRKSVAAPGGEPLRPASARECQARDLRLVVPDGQSVADQHGPLVLRPRSRPVTADSRPGNVARH